MSDIGAIMRLAPVIAVLVIDDVARARPIAEALARTWSEFDQGRIAPSLSSRVFLAAAVPARSKTVQLRLFCRTDRDSSRARGTWAEHRRLSLN